MEQILINININLNMSTLVEIYTYWSGFINIDHNWELFYNYLKREK